MRKWGGTTVKRQKIKEDMKVVKMVLKGVKSKSKNRKSSKNIKGSKSTNTNLTLSCFSPDLFILCNI